MKVKLLDLQKQYAKIKSEIEPIAKVIMDSQMFINGPYVKEFEDNFASFCEAKYAVGCSSGTDALLMSLTALDIGIGDEVITTPFTFFATVEVILRRGATPVFVDIEENTFNINTAQIENVITNKTKAIIPVHLFGQCANMTQVNDIADKYNLYVIEDACQAVGSSWDNKRAGSMGTTGCFSFFPSKNLGGFGDGGMVTTNDKKLYQKFLKTRQHGIDSKDPYNYEYVGGNFRLDAIQAAVLNIKLRHLEEWQEMRRVNASYYNENLSNFATPENISNSYHVYNQYTIKCEDRNKVKKHLQEKNIGCGVYYPYPIHLQKCISHLNYKEGDFPICERICKEVLSLPIYPELRKEELEYIVMELNSL
jgi:dTDP-4-amino-4,6-dideoxygalactose transaminase